MINLKGYAAHQLSCALHRLFAEHAAPPALI